MVRFLTIMSLLFLFIQTGCIGPSKIKVTLNSRSSAVSKAAATLSSVSIVNNQIVLSGANLNGVTQVRVSGPSVSETLSIESKSTTDLIANGTANIAFLLGGVFDLIISDARGAATYQVTFTLPNGSVTAPMLDTMGAVTPGQVLTWNGSDWEAQNAASGTIYLGVWDATANTPDLSLAGTSSGEYYIVTNETGSYLNGDWMIWDGFVWDHLSMTSVASVFGRGGDVVAQEGDISTINYLGDVNTVGAVSGQVLKYDGSSWIPSTDLNSGGSNLINNGSDAYLTGGYLGVGIESPTYAVHVKSTSGGLASMLGLQSLLSNLGEGASIDFTNSSTAKQAQISAMYESVNNTSLVFSTRNTNDSLQERVRINSAGYLGIGTNNPTSPLHVIGAANISDSVTGKTIHSMGAGNTVYASSSIASGSPIAGGASAAYLNVYNTTSADGYGAYSFLQVKNSNGNSQKAFVGAVSTSGVGVYSPAIVFGHTTGATAYDERMRIDSTGYVGIGTTTPSAKLDIAGGIRIADGTEADGYVLTTDSYGYASWQASSGGQWITNASDIYYSTGKVGIGNPTPSYELDILSPNGSLANFTSTSDTAYIQIRSNLSTGRSALGLSARNNSNPWQLVAQGSTNNILTFKPTFNINDGTISTLTLDDDGRVGIYNSAPTATLDITGNIRINDTTQGVGYVLTSDANGYGSWQLPSAANVTSSTTGYIASTNVNSAIAELESEKLSLSGDTILAGDFLFSGASTLRTDQTPVMLTDVTNVQYVQDYVANYGPWIDNVTAVYNLSADIGIGTDAPAASLHIVDTNAVLRVSRTANNADMMIFNTEGTTNSNRDVNIKFKSGDSTVTFAKMTAYYADSGNISFMAIGGDQSAFYATTNTGGLSQYGNRFGFNSSRPEFTVAYKGDTDSYLGVNSNPNANSDGSDLYLVAGGSTVGSTDKNGGSLVLASGYSSGTGLSEILFQTATQGVSSSTTNYVSTKMVISGAGNVGIGTTTPQAKLDVAGTIATAPNLIGAGGAVDLSLSNIHVLDSVGSSTIALSNLVNGASYTIIVRDNAVRTYSFTGCSTKFTPANGPTDASSETIYGVTTVNIASVWYCYISWSSGYQ